jgi:hypothetical protein
MPKRYDASFKEMFAHNFLALLRWLLPELSSAQVLKLPEELPVTARRADLMMRVRPKRGSAIRPPDLIVVFECQCQRDPTLHKALLLRAVLAHTLHGLPVKTIVLALSPRAVPPPGHVFGQGPDGEELWHRVTVRRVFDESADDALASGVAELLPLVTAMRPRDGDPDRLLRRVVTQIVRQAASDDKRKIMLEQAATFATLRLPESQVSVIVHDVLRRNRYMLNPLRDFPYLRAGYRKGKAEGLAKGKAEGLAKGKAEGLARGNAAGRAESLLILLDRRGIAVPPALRKKILGCTDVAQLDRWFVRAVTATSVTEILAAR